MKKIMLLILTCLFAFPIFSVAQGQEHLRFMGIPLNGTISQFQAKLQAKGVRYDAKSSSQLKFACRVFRGTFSGENANIYVYYNERTKIVYRAKAVITYSDINIGKRKFENFKYMLKEKYDKCLNIDDEQDNMPAWTLYVDSIKSDAFLGTISLYFHKDISYLDDVSLHIDYEDNANRNNNIKRNMDDL